MTHTLLRNANKGNYVRIVVKDSIYIKIFPDRMWFYLATTHALLLLRHYLHVSISVEVGLT